MRNFILLASLLVITAFVAFLSPLACAENNNKNIVVIEAAGEVGPAMAAYVARAVKGAADADIIILELDTFGGRVDSALKIVETMTRIKTARTISYVKNKAISAGALIALSCNDLVMASHTTIGDCAPISFSQGGAKMMGEKFQSPLRAKFRTLARRNNYPAALAEAMVSTRLEVFEVKWPKKTLYLEAADYKDLSKQEKAKVISKKVIVAKGELLTMDDAEAESLGFSRFTADSIEAALQKFGIKKYSITRLKPSWSEGLGRLLNSFAPILMMIGLAALYVEFKVPGFGLPGMVGILCLGLVFGNQYIIGLADHTELIFLMLGLVLLGFEVFVIPGFGVAGISGFILIGFAMILAMQDFVLPDPSLPWQQDIMFANLTKVSGAFVAAVAAGLIFIAYLLPKLSKIGKGPYLADSLADSHADSREAALVSLGDCGVASTFLRPSGKARFGSRHIDVVTEGDLIDRGADIKIIDIKGNRVIVARKEQ